MFARKSSKHMLGVLVGGPALAIWVVLGTCGATPAVAAAPPPPPPPPPANPVIVFQSTDGLALIVCDADGRNATEIVPATPGGSVYQISWSPDGGSIVYTHWDHGTAAEMHAVDVSVVNGVPVGSNLRTIPGSVGARGVAWSPLGDQIAFTTNAGDISVIPPTGGTRTVLWQSPSGDRADGANLVAWSPSGNRIAAAVWIPGTTTNNYMILDVASLQTTIVPLQMNPQPEAPQALEWARTSDTLAAVSWWTIGKRRDARALYEVDIATGATTVISTALGMLTASPSPDDSLYVTSMGSRLVLSTINRATGQVVNLGPRDTYRVAWRR